MIKINGLDDIQPSPDSPLETELVTKMYNKLRVDIVDKQDALIMNAIRLIGGDQYHHITIDKSKVIDALSKSVPKKVTMETKTPTFFNYRCPNCMDSIVALDNKIARVWKLDKNETRAKVQKEFGDKYRYCSKCGQALDWEI